MRVWSISIAVSLSMSAASADTDSVGNVVFEYVDQTQSQCISGIEAPFRAALSNIDLILLPVPDLFTDAAVCYKSVRRGVEVTRSAVECKDGTKKKALGVPARLSGTIDACQRGPEVRLMDSALTVSLSSDKGSWDVAVSLGARRYSVFHDFNSFIESLIMRQSWTGKRGGIQKQFDRRPTKLKAIIEDVPIQDEDKLPTGDVYGIKIDTQIAAKFGTIYNTKDGETQ